MGKFITLLAGLVGSDVTVTFEITATIPTGATENLVPTANRLCAKALLCLSPCIRLYEAFILDLPLSPPELHL